MITPKVQVQGNFDKVEMLRRAYAKADGSHFTLGVHEDAGKYKAKQKRSASGQFAGMDNPPAVGEVAWWLEKGTKYMPARPFLGPAIDENIGVVRQAMATGLVGMGLKGWTVEKALTGVASICLTLVQNKVKSNVGPALSGTWEPPSGYLGWKKLQGMAQRTLVATGLMYRSLAYRIFLSDGAELEAARAAGAAGPGAEESTEDYVAKRARAREEAKRDKRAASEQKRAQSGRDIFGKYITREQEAAKAKTGKAHQAAKARRGKYRKR